MKELLIDLLKQIGGKLPKKHGDWFRVNVYGNHYLILDTWNKEIYHYPNGATPSDTNNMYNCVYVFFDNEGNQRCKSVNDTMSSFWYAHLCYKRFN